MGPQAAAGIGEQSGAWQQLGIKKAQSEDKADWGPGLRDETFNGTWLEAKEHWKELRRGPGVQRATSARPQLCRTFFLSVSGPGRGSCGASPEVADAGQLRAEG